MTDTTHTAAQVRFDLRPHVESILFEQREKRDRITRPLAGFPNLKLVLIAMPAGTRWNEHSTPGRISVQCLHGVIRMHALGDSFDLAPGQVFALESNIKHDVEALEESVFLLTVARCD